MSDTVREVVRIRGIERLAVLNCVKRWIEGLIRKHEQRVRKQITAKFVDNILENGIKPDAFCAVEGNSEATCFLRKRSVASNLSDEEIAVLTRHELPYATMKVSEETFMINPKYMTDINLVAKVSNALQNIDDAPEDLVIFKRGEQKYVIDDETIDAICKRVRNREDLEKVLEISTTLTMNTNYQKDIGSALDKFYLQSLKEVNK